MAVSLKTNLSALSALRRVDQATTRLAGIYDHLSSGLRITRPSDDAAGLSIASALKADERVYGQGIRNINDGLSLLNTAEGALSQLSNIVIRQKELAEQAANGVYSSKQRLALQKEANALVKEYNRILRATSFNGEKIIDGISDALTLQQGYGANESTLLSLSQQLGYAAGSGDFQSVSYAGLDPGTAGGIAVGDINGDGIPDLISAYDNTVSIRIGTNSGSFDTAIGSILTSATLKDVRLVDINNDGTLDLIGSDQSGELSVFLGNGNGTFRAGQTYAIQVAETGFDAEDFTLDDLNGDGYLDMVYGMGELGSVGIMFGNGNGSFKASISIATPVGGTSNVRVTDLNNDGILDLVVGGSNSNSAKVSVFLGNGNGTYLAPTSFAVGARAGAVAVGDFNGDGYMDFVAGNQDGQMYFFSGNGDGTFRASLTFDGLGGEGITGIEVADINGDGHLDVIAAFGNGANAGVYLGNGNGTFNAVKSIAALDSIHSMAIADLNGDGIPDIVGGIAPSGNLRLATGIADTSGRRNNFTYDLNLLTTFGAREALSRTTEILSRISRELGAVGALQSRLGYSLSNLTTRKTNYADAGGRILDADIAQESANLVSTQILQQASTAVLSQANQQTRIALTLLNF